MAKAEDSQEAKAKEAKLESELAGFKRESEKAAEELEIVKKLREKSLQVENTAKEEKRKVEAEAKKAKEGDEGKIATLNKRVSELEGKVKVAGQTLQTEVLRVKKQQLASEKAREEVNGEVRQRQRA